MSSTVGRAHEAVLAAIEADLTAGRLHVGSKLPGERTLAAQLGVGRSSVREAIRVLEAMGVIRTAVGSGAEAGAVVIAEPSAGLTAALRLHLASRQLPVTDIVDTRVLLESHSCRAAARQPDPLLLGAAARLLDEMDGLGDPVEFHALDIRFHLLLAEAGGNAVVTAIMGALAGSIAGYVLDAVTESGAWPVTARRLRRQHRQILGAVRDGDGDRAARLVTRHIEGFHQQYVAIGSVSTCC